MEGLFGDRQAVDAEEVAINDTLLTVSVPYTIRNSGNIQVAIYKRYTYS